MTRGLQGRLRHAGWQRRRLSRACRSGATDIATARVGATRNYATSWRLAAGLVIAACVSAPGLACSLGGPPYRLSADVVDWSMTVAPGETCLRGLRLRDVTLDSVQLESAPRSGRVAVQGPGLSFAADKNFDGEDSFTVTLSGMRVGHRGQSTIRIAVYSVLGAGAEPRPLQSRDRATPGEGRMVPAKRDIESADGNVAQWNVMKIGAGGFVTGIDIAPDGTKVVRTDTYGGYVWDAAAATWRQVLTAQSLPKQEAGADVAGGIYEIAIAPSRSSRLYMLLSGHIFRSDDGGRAWTRTGFRQVPGIDANAATKLFGRYIAVDPADPDVAYVGTPANGLWFTGDGGATWSRVDGIPPARSSGLGQGGGHLVAFDRSSTLSGGRTQGIYATSYGTGVYHSVDGGLSWTLTPGTPKTHQHLVVDRDGTVFLTDSDGGASNVNRFDGRTWSQLPVGNRGHSIAVDPANPARIFIGIDSGDLIISTDGGAHWVGPTFEHAQRRATDVPWLAWTNEIYMSNGDMAFDPGGSNSLYFAEGIGVWHCNPPDRVDPVVWQSQNAGIEQLVGNMVLAAPGGRPLALAWDRPVFRVEEADAYPAAHGPDNANALIMGWSADWAAPSPDTIVAIMNWWQADVSGVSRDGGRTWQRFAAQPDEVPAKIGGGIAAASADNFIWVPSNNGNPWRTVDGGAHWTRIAVPGVPTTGETGWGFAYYLNRQIVAADRVAPDTFYLYNSGPSVARSAAGLYRSVDKGVTWMRVHQGEIAHFSGFNALLKAVPGQAGHLFFSSGRQSGAHPAATRFMRSTDGGNTWAPVAGFAEVHAFGFGAAYPGRDYPAIFVAGYNGPEWGLWRSIDNAESWAKIGDYPLGSHDAIKSIEGDKVKVGTVYIAFAGSGFAYRGN